MPAQLTPLIDEFLSGRSSPLAGLGSTFVSQGQKYGVDPRLLVAIAGAETSFGGYGPSQRIRNPFGMGPGIQYPSYAAAIAAAAKNLGQNYIGEGLDTIPEIQGKWAPSGAKNDPTGLNNNWVRNVSAYYKQLGGDPGVSAETTRYLSDAADLESRFAGVGDDAANAHAPSLSPEKMHEISGIAELVANPKQAQLQPVRGLGELSERVQPLPAMETDIGSTALAKVNIQKSIEDRLTKQALAAGLGVEFDHKGPLAPNAPAFMGSVAEYMQSHPVVGEVISEAKGFLGTPYKWGGESPKEGFDCSGFAQWLYGQQGIQLPRVTYDQIKSGVGVGFKDLAPGDLVFFGTKKDPHHEGIYIGNGQFIHAPKTGDVVKISSLTDGYYKQHFVTGRRVTR